MDLFRNKKIPPLAKILGAVAVLAAGTLFGAYQYFSRDLPSTARLETIEPALKTQVFAEDGSVIGEFYVEDRALVPLEEMPKYLIDAIIAIEDRKFYSHWGLDIFGITRAFFTNVRHGRYVQGGSTITQQLARNLFDMYENNLSRKVKEALLALRIERAYSKDEILGMYRITAHRSDYLPFTSPEIDVVDTPARLNIPLAQWWQVYLPVVLRQFP